MLILADHINLWTSIPVTIFFGAVLTLIALPTSALAFILGRFLRKPFGVIVGTLVAMPALIFVTEFYTCWGCPDHQINRRFIDPISGYAGGLAMGYAIARFGQAGRDKWERQQWPKPR